MKYFLTVLILVSGSFQSFAVECSIKVRVTEFKPQYYKTPNGWTGLAVELGKALLNEANCKPTFVVIPWKRSLIQIKNGKLDMMMNLSITDERKKFMHFIGPMRDESMVLIVYKNSNYQINSLDDIKKLPKQITIENGAYYGETFDKKYKTDSDFKNKFIPITNTASKSKMLSGKRVVAFIEDRYTAAYKLKNVSDYQDFKIHPFFINQDNVFFGLSKKSIDETKLKMLEQALKKAKESGKFQQILKKYQ